MVNIAEEEQEMQNNIQPENRSNKKTFPPINSKGFSTNDEKKPKTQAPSSATGLFDYIKIRDRKLQKYFTKKPAISEVFEAYFDERIDFTGDLEQFMESRESNIKFKLLTFKHIKFFMTRFIPEVLIHSRNQDQRIGREHYDRGNDFFHSFLGDRMIYTSGFFKTGEESLEQAQDQKMDLVCNKLKLETNDNYLDIGCGWGTLAMHAAKKFSVQATGITIAEHQTAYAQQKIRDNGLLEKAKVLCLDYRDIPDGKYNKISCLEMSEHVGIKNYPKFCRQMYRLLDNDGMFFLQIAGLRRIHLMEDLIWGLFMNKYIFPGADASMPLAWVINQFEKANFEIHSVETIGVHYSLTIKRWYDNWIRNKETVVKQYGERWYRIWHVFLAWSVIIARQGSSTCYQIVANKNLNKFDRKRYFSFPQLGEQEFQYPRLGH